MTGYREFAEQLARRAGRMILENFSLGMKKEWKEDSTPLTATDKAINEMVINAVRERYPKHGIIAEEGSSHDGQEWTWICDPVDGTIPFSHGIPISTFMLALTRNGESVLGVVYDPFQDRLFVAEKGTGACLNGKRIHVADRHEFRSSLISMNYWRGERILRETHYALVQEDAVVIVMPSIGYLDTLVAAGELSASIFAGFEPWDSAAASVIVKEAGGVFTDLRGNEPRFTGKLEGHIAANPAMHAKLLALVKRDLDSSFQS